MIILVVNWRQWHLSFRLKAWYSFTSLLRLCSVQKWCLFSWRRYALLITLMFVSVIRQLNSLSYLMLHTFHMIIFLYDYRLISGLLIMVIVNSIFLIIYALNNLIVVIFSWFFRIIYTYHFMFKLQKGLSRYLGL
jgi:hypothetical protein